MTDSIVFALAFFIAGWPVFLSLFVVRGATGRHIWRASEESR